MRSNFLRRTIPVIVLLAALALAAIAGAASDTTVTTHRTSKGKVLANSRGFSLYMFKKDKQGGKGKQAPYSPLADLIRTRVRKMILIGADARVIESELKDAAPFEHATDMQDAVERAFAAAQTGDVVLLAPACASFDMFESFEHRGRVFKEEVSNLSERGTSPIVREDSV